MGGSLSSWSPPRLSPKAPCRPCCSIRRRGHHGHRRSKSFPKRKALTEQFWWQAMDPWWVGDSWWLLVINVKSRYVLGWRNSDYFRLTPKIVINYCWCVHELRNYQSWVNIAYFLKQGTCGKSARYPIIWLVIVVSKYNFRTSTKNWWGYTMLENESD